jgi:spore germination cell wall hydrolase CwlJ-like protein
MKLSTTFLVLILLTIPVTFAQGSASMFVLEQKDGTKLYMSDEGIIQKELFTREQDPEAYCLAENIYFEARNDTTAGQAAVADVVINRVNDHRYPDTICQVVQDGPIRESWKTRQDPMLSDDERVYYPVKNKCQFSWYCDGKAENINDQDAWAKAQYIAYQMIYAERFRGITEGSTHYHAHYVNPSWAKRIQFVGSIESHKFYRLP